MENSAPAPPGPATANPEMLKSGLAEVGSAGGAGWMAGCAEGLGAGPKNARITHPES